MHGRYIVAAILIILGTGFLLDQMNVLYFSDIISNWWPLIIIAIGLVLLTRSHGALMPAMIVLIIGVLLQANELHMLPWGFWATFWPLMLVAIGVGILFSKRKHVKNHQFNRDLIDIVALFTAGKHVIKTDDFKGGDISTIFGGADLDLRYAEMKSGKATLDLFVAFGGVNIKVPENWRIEGSGLPLFGGYDDKTRQNYVDLTTAPVLQIKYFVMFGGVEVKN